MISFKRIFSRPLKCVWEYLWSKVDIGFKRMCLIASLHAVIKDCCESDITGLTSLNESLDLVKDVNALRLPVLLGPVMWSRALHFEKLDFEQDNAVKRILRKLPCWIKYSDDVTMGEDISKLFSYYREQQLA